MKRLLRVVLVLVVLLVAAVIVGVVMIDRLAKAGLEKGATYALGVPTTVDEVDVRLLKGEVSIRGLNVPNPEGFSAGNLLHQGRFDLSVRPGSLLEDAVEVGLLQLDGLHVSIEQKATGSNVGRVIENLQRLSGTPAPDGSSESRRKKVKVNRVVIRNVVADFRLLPDLVGQKVLTVKVPDIELTDVTSDSAGGVPMDRFVGRIVLSVLAAVLDSSRGTVPDSFRAGLSDQLSTAAAGFGQQVDSLVGQVRGQLDRQLRDALGPPGKTLLDGLLNGAKLTGRKKSPGGDSGP